MPEQSLPSFLNPEQCLIEKIETLHRDLHAELNKISQADNKINISPNDQKQIRSILLKTQTDLTQSIRTHGQTSLLLRVYHNVNQFEHQVNEMEVMFRQMLINCMLKPDHADDDEILLGLNETAASELANKSLEELFSELTRIDYQRLLVPNKGDALHTILEIGRLSGAIDESARRLFDKNSEEAIFLKRFFDTRRIVAQAIEQIHNIIHHKNTNSAQAAPENSTSSDRRHARTKQNDNPNEECCYEFGLLSTCRQMQNEVKNLLKTNNKAQAKRIDILQKIAYLDGKKSVSDNSASDSNTSSTGCSSSTITSSDNDSSDHDSNRASSVSSSSNSSSRSPSVSSSAARGFFATAAKSRGASRENARHARGPNV